MRRGSIFKITIMSKTVEQRADEFINEYFNIEQHGALNAGKANDFMEKSKHEAQMKAAYIKGAADQKETDIKDIFTHVGLYLRNNLLSHIVDEGNNRVLNIDALMYNMINDYQTAKVYTAKGTYHKKGE